MAQFCKVHSTHKFWVSDITSSSGAINMCRVRPIVSCCGSPTEKLFWLVTKIFSPLLDYIPSHLQNIHTHLTTLSELSPEQLYLQLVGLFMGCKPSPLGAIMRVYTFERRSIYIDPHFLPIVSRIYVRYVDDAGTLAKLSEEATAAFSCIASQDPEGRLGRKIDFPESDTDWTPFLDTQIRIDRDGKLHTSFTARSRRSTSLIT